MKSSLYTYTTIIILQKIDSSRIVLFRYLDFAVVSLKDVDEDGDGHCLMAELQVVLCEGVRVGRVVRG